MKFRLLGTSNLLKQRRKIMRTKEEIREKYNLPVVETKKVAYGAGPKWDIATNHVAMIDSSNHRLFGIHSDLYRLARHEEGIALLDEAVSKNPEFGKPEYNVELYDEGRRMKAIARFPEVEIPVTKKTRDIVNPTIEYTNSYDGGWAEKLVLGAYRLVCSNGLIVGQKFLMARSVHAGETRPEQFMMGVADALDNFSMQVGLWKQWADKKLQREEVLKDVNITDDVGNTLISTWLFFNILTAYITHKVASLNRRVGLQESLRKSVSNW